MESNKFAALTQGISNPSARFRIRQLIGPLSEFGHQIDELISMPGSYPPRGLLQRFSWGAEAIFDALKRSIKSREYKATIMQRELISTLPSFELFLKKPIILDVDDAIWLHRGGIAANYLAGLSSHIVVGNSYLAEFFSRFGVPISQIPTSVQIDRFLPLNLLRCDDRGIIGWSGTSGGYNFFTPQILESIGCLLKKKPGWRLRIVSNCPPLFSAIPVDQLDYIPWTAESEAGLIASMDIGLMPLANNPWCLGKCSYKMLLYMSCGVPVVVSSYGMNAEIIANSRVGLGVINANEWGDAIEYLIDNPSERMSMGVVGRQAVIDKYSTSVVANSWHDVLSKFN